MKDGKGRVVWDGSMKLEPLDVVMNDYTPTDNEPEVTFGTAKKSFYWLIYNLRASYISRGTNSFGFGRYQSLFQISKDSPGFDRRI